MPRHAAAGCLLVLTACGRAPAPAPVPAEPTATTPGFVDRVPADTRAVASLDLGSVLGQTLLATFGDAEGCAPLPAAGQLDLAVTGRSALIAEVHGAITVADLACRFGREPDADGRLQLGSATIEGRPDGIRMTSGVTEPAGAAWPLAEAFATLDARHQLVAMATVGPADAPIVVEAIADDDAQRWTLTFEHDDDAAAAAAAITEVVRHAGALDPNQAAMVPVIDGPRLTISPGSAALSDALRGSLQSQVLEAFRIPSASMLPTLEIGDHVYALKGDLIGDLRRGDLVIHEPAGMPGTRFVKRVVAIGGDTVHCDEVGVTVNGVPQPLRPVAGRYRAHDYDGDDDSWPVVEGELLDEVFDGRSHRILDIGDGGAPPGTFTVPADHVFVLGDNRRNSADSRVYGAVPRSSVIAVPRLIWMSYGPDGVRWERILTPVQ